MSMIIEVNATGLALCREIVREEAARNPEALLRVSRALGWDDAALLQIVAADNDAVLRNGA